MSSSHCAPDANATREAYGNICLVGLGVMPELTQSITKKKFADIPLG